MAKTDEKKEQKTEKAIIARNMQVNGTGLVLRTLEDMKLAAETFINSRLVPKHFDSGAKIIVALQAGAELGLKPWQSLQSLHVVNGVIGIKSSVIGGLIRQSGKNKYLKQYYEGKKGADDYRAVVKSQRTDDTTEHISEFSVDDAKEAELWGKDNWRHYPTDMLMWRALSRHGRAYYGDVLAGFYTVEELREIHPPEEVPTPEVAPRDERKEAEDVVVKDSQAVIAEELGKCLDVFAGCAEFSLGEGSLKKVPTVVLHEAFAKFAASTLKDKETDYRQPEAYTLDNLGLLTVTLEERGIPDKILALIPTPAQQLEEAEKTAEEKIGHEYKWKCLSETCGEVFDAPIKKKGGVKLCPKCLCKKVESLEEVEAEK